jgi:small subunit ribosomal protein S6
MQYELFYLVGASKEAELEKIKQEVAALVTSEGGVFEEKQVVEKRKTAYEINHENRGFYVAQRFNLEDPVKIQDITRKINLYTEILRFVITRTEDLPELTSREEREKKAKAEPRMETRKPVLAEVKMEAKPAEEKTVEAPAIETAAKKQADSEDIDKKLEEILNI